MIPTPFRGLPIALAALVAAGAMRASEPIGAATATATALPWLDGMSDSPWVYWLLGASAIVTEELAPIFGGIAAHEGELDLVRVITALTIGGWIATTLLYFVGRTKWETIRRRWPSTRAAGTVALRVVARNPVTASFLVRFAFGLRILLPVACGAARVPPALYLVASLVGSALWSAVFTLIGYVAGEAAVRMIGKLDRAGEIIGAILVTALVLGVMRWNRKRTQRKREKQLRRRVTDP